MDLKLFQEDVARIIRVSTDSVTYWENGRAIPQIQHMPKIISFLGYNPVSSDLTTLYGRVKEYRVTHGLSHKELGRVLGVDASTVGSWEFGEFEPAEKTRHKLRTLFKEIIRESSV